MATQPDPHPDTIEPVSPPEAPPDSLPLEDPMQEPGEIEQPDPDFDRPDRSPIETPPPPD